MEPNVLRMEITAKPENVSFARVAVAAFASQLDWNLNELEEIKVAVSEAVSNSIIHGYKKKGNGTIQIIVTIEDNGIGIIVEDKGVGIRNIEEALQPAFSSEPERMGLGFVFMKSFMDEFDVESFQQKGTRVTMKKSFGEIIENRAIQ